MKKEVLKAIGRFWAALIGLTTAVFGMAYASAWMEKKYGEPVSIVAFVLFILVVVSVVTYWDADE